ncbi:MAG: ThuA domain-containing protein [Luteolibacter sp.]
MKPNPLLLAAFIGIVASFFWLSSTAEETPAQEKRKIVFVAGKASHGPGAHEHKAGSMLFADHLDKSGLPIETVVVTNGWPKDESVFDGASAVIFYADGGKKHPAVPHLDKLNELIKDGVGIGCIHYGIEVEKGDAGNTFLDATGGHFEKNWSVNPHWEATFVMPDHEVANGIEDYTMLDEWYYHMRFRPDMEGVTPILSDLPPEKSLSRPDGPHSGNPAVRKAVLEDKEPQHVMWVFERPDEIGGGRGFGFSGGHFHKNWQNDSQRRVVLNAIAWIAGMDIPEQGIPSPTPTDEEMTANLDVKKAPKKK